MTERITVLCIDDERAYAELLRTYLEDIFETEFEMETATDPVAGRAHVDDHDVDCVVCDYDMPEMDGLELLANLREEYPSLPFVLLTGQGSETVASEAIRLGTTDYVPKPSGSKEYKMLSNRIRSAISQYRRHQKARREIDRLRTAFDRFDAALVGLDPEWRYTFLNDRAETLIGQSEGKLLETTVWGSFADTGETSFEAAFRRSMREQEPLTVEEYSDPLERRLRVSIHPGPDGVTLAVREPDESDS